MNFQYISAEKIIQDIVKKNVKTVDNNNKIIAIAYYGCTNLRT